MHCDMSDGGKSSAAFLKTTARGLRVQFAMKFSHGMPVRMLHSILFERQSRDLVNIRSMARTMGTGAALVILAILSVTFSSSIAKTQDSSDGARFAALNNVVWSTMGTGQSDSMPIGNGDLAANVWTEQNGDIVLLLAKADAWTETGKLVKLGRIRIHITPSLFAGAQFSQTLHLESGAIELHENGNTALIWIDANHPAMHIEMHADRPVTVHAALETWRRSHPLTAPSPDKNGMFELGSDAMPVSFVADRILPGKNRVAWFHFNKESIYPTVLRQEHLEALIGKYPDPLLHRCFGAMLLGPGIRNDGAQSLISSTAQRDPRIDIVAASGRCQKPEAWQDTLDAIAPTATPADLHTAWQKHVQWWHDFWNRSWIHVDGPPEARQVSQGYAIQRYMMASSSRGELPVKFNGGLFTVGGQITAKKAASEGQAPVIQEINPDYRAWGNCYWNQNNRLLYWPLIATGDYDLLKPWFDMYLRALPLEKDRTRIYYHHAGASYPETMFFWGLPSLHDFGWNNPTNEISSRWQRYHIQGSLEVAAQMLDYYEYTGDQNFARTALVPFADAIITFYGDHWPRGTDGKIRMYPAQSLETYQLTILNPTPDIAGLRSLIPRLLALPKGLTTNRQRVFWTQTLSALPSLPMGTTAANGKTPPNGMGDPSGTRILLPAESYGKTSNSENPELYVTFPYHLYGLDKPGLRLALDTFAARRSPQNTCWGQDGTESAVLGLTSVAQKAVEAEFTNFGDERFQWFWKPAHDWIPDLDNGGSGMITLQEMLLQPDGKKILLLPAWPKGWTADFRLHAPFETIVEGRVERGKLVRIVVMPSSRKSDLVVVPAPD
jgi:alpha-L-fucosidase 2